MSEHNMVRAEALSKRYGETQALDDVDLEVATGSILGVLGPNGAGKTTALRILTTLSTPDSGRAWVAGHDVVADGAAVRRKIGVTGQDATLDELLTGRQNLMMIGQLSRLERAEARRRSKELLELFELTDAADRMVKGYSGGMRRRLDLAASLVMRPPVLFLDEPTTGLDPTSRQRMWGVIRGLVADGVTVLLTTQYLDEADALADGIVVIDRGRVIARGTPRELKAATGSQLLEVTLAEPHLGAARELAAFSVGAVQTSEDGTRLWTPARNEAGLAVAALRVLDEAGALVDDITVHRPSLDDVFAVLTGATIAPHAEGAEVPA
jgi:ABC-2 type transport system ATP-binding protein